MKKLLLNFRELARYPSAALGLAVILLIVGLAIYALIAIPYPEAIRLWVGGEDIWGDHPKNAQPVWVDLFTKSNLPRTIVLNSQDQSADSPVRKTRQAITDELTDVTITMPFEYPYDGFPQELSVYFTAEYSEKQPIVSLIWATPDGREIPLAELSPQKSETYRVLQDTRLKRTLGEAPPEQALFADPDSETPVSLKGDYELRVAATVFEEDADLDVKLVVYGQVHGLAGTDHRRRDLTVALLWGTPIALAFGLLAALGTTLVTMFIAAIGVWFGGWVDSLIQRITEVNLVLPFLPILIMVGTFYSRSIWLMLGCAILLNIFGGAIKNYRAIFLQVRESPYIEAARTYGAGNWRIIIFYLIPRIIPVLIPQFVNVIPTFVFLEASLAVLGLGDPVLPTWGKVIDDARSNGALFQGQYYWVLEPSILLMMTGLAFALLGFALDRVFNPRLRGL